MRLLSPLFFLCIIQPLFAQQININPGSTYAVVVGISDYQDEEIPDLLFADKDAEAFANFLRSPAGGALDEDHLKVLVNKEATGAQIARTLDWLIDEAQEGDKIIIYFSGHGDVEAKRISQPGYLLGWDSPSQVYAAGGAMNIRDLQDIVSTLSVYNKAKVTLITDACRSGKLSGSDINGAQLTSQNLSRQFKNETKILSCQANEYSIEGEQWGGGRGAFSYHLVDGLYGLADSNGDLAVSLMEIGRYLQDRVTNEVAPQSQIPMAIGNFGETLVTIQPEWLEKVKNRKKGEMQLFSSTESKGIEQQVLALADTNIRVLYNAFVQALDDKQFLSPENTCADYYYNTLNQEPQLKRLHSSMRRNYAAALQDDAQQVLNKLLKSDPGENSKTMASISRDYSQFPKNLRRAADLLGEDHYMHSVLLARSYWFEGYIADESRCACKNIPNANKVLPYYQKALEHQPEMPHAFAQIAAVYGIQKHEPDSAAIYANLALEAVPNWTLVHHWMANSYLNHCKNFGSIESLVKAKHWLDRGMKIDSNSVPILNELAYWYNLKGQYQNEQETLDRSFSLAPLAKTIFYKGEGFYSWGKYKEAEKAFLSAVAMDSTLLTELGTLLRLYNESNQIEKGMALAEKILSVDPTTLQPNIYSYLANIFVKGNELATAENLYLKSVEINPDNHVIINRWGLMYWRTKQLQKAIEKFQTAISFFPENPIYNNNLGLLYLTLNHFEKAKQKFLDAESIAISNGIDKWFRRHACLYMLYLQNGMVKEAKEELKRGMEMDADNLLKWMSRIIGDALQHPETVPIYFEKIIELYPDHPLAYYFFSVYNSKHGNLDGSFELLEMALKKGYNDFNKISRSFEFSQLRDQEAKWNILMEKYFPEEVND
jgi:tetratricopeptide (TPR) repeat protein